MQILSQWCSDGKLLSVDFQNRHLCIYFELILPLICSPYIRKLFGNGFLMQHQDTNFSTVVLVCIYIECSLGDNCVNYMFTCTTVSCEAKALFVSQCIKVSAKFLKCRDTSHFKVYFILLSLILHKEKSLHQNLMYIVSIHYVIHSSRFIFLLRTAL